MAGRAWPAPYSTDGTARSAPPALKGGRRAGRPAGPAPGASPRGEEAEELIARARGAARCSSRSWHAGCEGEPLAWLTGQARFGDSRLRVDPGVYVPRWQSIVLAPARRGAAPRARVRARPVHRIGRRRRRARGGPPRGAGGRNGQRPARRRLRSGQRRGRRSKATCSARCRRRCTAPSTWWWRSSPTCPRTSARAPPPRHPALRRSRALRRRARRDRHPPPRRHGGAPLPAARRCAPARARGRAGDRCSIRVLEANGFVARRHLGRRRGRPPRPRGHHGRPTGRA